MKLKHLTYLIICGVIIFSCKKDKGNTNNSNNNTNKTPSKMGLICNQWTLKETYEDGIQKSANGTDQYRFQADGKFMYKNGSTWEEIGTYTFNDKDSTSISTLFNGMTMSYWMTLKQFDEHNCNTEFIVTGGKKLEYRYVR